MAGPWTPEPAPGQGWGLLGAETVWLLRPHLGKEVMAPHARGRWEPSPNFTLNLKGHSPSGLIGFGSLKLIVWVVKLACLPSQFKKEDAKLPTYYELGSRHTSSAMNSESLD